MLLQLTLILFRTPIDDFDYRSLPSPIRILFDLIIVSWRQNLCAFCGKKRVRCEHVYTMGSVITCALKLNNLKRKLKINFILKIYFLKHLKY